MALLELPSSQSILKYWVGEVPIMAGAGGVGGVLLPPSLPLLLVMLVWPLSQTVLP